MVLQRTFTLFHSTGSLRKMYGDGRLPCRSRTTSPTGAILPEPKRTRFGLLGVVCSVLTGLVIGTNLSKMMANYLEEKELFVPSDDDDDDDDD